MAESKARFLRLSGRLGNRHHNFPLRPGDMNVGSASTNQIVLLDRSVSRRHALLRLKGSAVEVRDLDSTNGTFVGLRRVARATACPGEMLRFGAISLRLEAIDPDDAKLALETGRPASFEPGERRYRGGETTKISILGPRERSWLGLLETIARILARRDENPLTDALGVLRQTLGATTIALVQFGPESELAIRASAGKISRYRQPLLARLNRLHGEPGEIACAVPTTEDPCPPTLALLNQPSGNLAIVVEGGFEGRAESQPLLALTLRLMASKIDETVRHHSRPRARKARPEDDSLWFPEGYVAGASTAMKDIYSRIEAVRHSNLPTLITGETGVGKEPLATILHGNSLQKNGPLVAINCAAIPADLLEAELFGIAKGAATGVHKRQGKFLEAHGGSILLDEVGEFELSLQAKLLRALQEKEITPVGGSPIRVETKIIASTNRNLRQEMAKGQFRSDLYFRLAGCVIDVPPLRQRQEDIAPLLQHFLDRYAFEANKTFRGVTMKALAALTDYPWPGNVRELNHESRRLALLCEDTQTIDFPLLSEPIRNPAATKD